MNAGSALRQMAPLLGGLLSRLPGVNAALGRHARDPSMISGRYCYGVWLKHLTLAWPHGMEKIPDCVVEIGPGSSLGTGVAALLCGATRYAALDVVRSARTQATRKVFPEILGLLQERSGRPTRGWPDYDALLDARLFPSHILTEPQLQASLHPDRVKMVGEAIAQLGGADQHPALRYGTWRDAPPLEDGQADFAFSHVVMDEVADLDAVYGCCARLLRSGGWMSHQIDFSSLGLTPEWNGHLRYDEQHWRLISGKRHYFVNRERCSGHVARILRQGFDIVAVDRCQRFNGIHRSELAPRWRDIPNEDLNCSAAFIVARKR